MNKKNKRKQARKILPVILALVMMLSLMTFAVSAEESACNGVHIWTGDEINRDEGTLVVRCVECSYSFDAYIVRIDEEKHCDAEMYAAYVDSVSFDDDNEAGVVYEMTRCSCSDEDIYGMRNYYFSINPPATPEENKSMIGSMVETITDSLGGILTGVGASIVSFFDATVLTTNEAGVTELTTFAVWALAFLGIGFGLGVVKFITNIVRKR